MKTLTLKPRQLAKLDLRPGRTQRLALPDTAICPGAGKPNPFGPMGEHLVLYDPGARQAVTVLVERVELFSAKARGPRGALPLATNSRAPLVWVARIRGAA